jgi:hypothetical protein
MWIDSNKIFGACGLFSLHAGSTITFGGEQTTVFTGNVGLSPGTSVTGHYSINEGQLLINDATSSECQHDKLRAYNTINSIECPNENKSANADLSGQTIYKGVYCANTITTGASSVVTLDAEGDVDAEWIFQVHTTLTTGASTKFNLVNGASPNNIYWNIGTSATLGALTNLVGNTIAGASVTVNTGTTVQGRILVSAAITFASGSDIYLSIPNTQSPTTSPTGNPTNAPTTSPSSNPTSNPTTSPSSNPTTSPSSNPSSMSHAPSGAPYGYPTAIPSSEPSSTPSCIHVPEGYTLVVEVKVALTGVTVTEFESLITEFQTSLEEYYNVEEVIVTSVAGVGRRLLHELVIDYNIVTTGGTEAASVADLTKSIDGGNAIISAVKEAGVKVVDKELIIVVEVKDVEKTLFDEAAILAIKEKVRETPTTSPTSNPTSSPTSNPTSSPTSNPTSSPTSNPTSSPTSWIDNWIDNNPTDPLTIGPTASPTYLPTSAPTTSPTSNPTTSSTIGPTTSPTSNPTTSSTIGPTASPTYLPTSAPTTSPTSNPTTSSTSAPTTSSTGAPTDVPNGDPKYADDDHGKSPTNANTNDPTNTNANTNGPTNANTNGPTNANTNGPTNANTNAPTNSDTKPSQSTNGILKVNNFIIIMIVIIGIPLFCWYLQTE